MLNRLSVVLATAAAGAMLAAPAFAQTAPGQDCPNPGGVYPPGTCPTSSPFPGQGKGVSDGQPGRGQEMSASSGRAAFDAGSPVEYGVESTYVRLGTTTADATGAATATFVVPTTLANGSHDVVFRGVKDGQATTVRVPFTVSGGAALAGTVTSPRTGVLGALPRTGADEVVPLAATGIALVVAGAGAVVVARRRRSELDAPAA